MSVDLLTAEEFRRKLAGMVDPRRTMPEMELDAVKDEAINFCSTLASLFGDDLDRKTLWERIGNGIVTSVAKCGGEIEVFMNEMLDYIKADPGKVAASKNMEMHIQMFATRPKEWKDAFLKIMETRHFIIVVKARTLWNMNKKSEG